MPRSVSKPAIVSTAVDEAVSTAGLIPSPNLHDWGTTPTMISSDGVSPANLKCATNSGSPGSWSVKRSWRFGETLGER
jgi:hypothetical protein